MLFGHQSDTAQHDATQVAPSQSTSASQDSAGTTNPLAVDPDTGISYPAVQTDAPDATDNSTEPSVLDQPSTVDTTTQTFSSDPAPTSPFGTDQAPQQSSLEDTSSTQPEPSTETPDTHSASTSDSPSTSIPDPAPAAPAAPEPTTNVSGGDDLLDLKQQALSQLGPLVNHLDQAPEEKFRTTMMLIQSTDNPALLKDAYDAAQAITDDKTRAQALLDVVNEINYFTQQGASNGSTA